MKDTKLLIGASWYPEVWPQSQWPKDLARMRELGFNVVRLFEFAWKRLEPSEGRYDFDWARRVMDLCGEAGIAVMIGTPTAAPPGWLTSRYPEVLRTRPDGSRATHGMRKHYSHVSRRYRELATGIASRMAQELSGHPALHSWQIDNEMSGRDYSEETRGLFHAYLRRRFGTIDRLNEAWGLDFWSQAYDRFEQIPLPTASVGSIEVPERHHPSLILAAARFFSDQWTAYINAQCDAIRAHSDKPITTNMSGTALASDWFDHNKPLDRVGFSQYKDVSHYDWSVMFFERMRGEKPGRPYWLLETAPNWSGGGRQWNIHHHAAGVKAFSWLSTLLGGSMVLYWQWRSHWAGQEMQHGTCVDASGRWRPNKEAWTELASRFAEQSDFLLNHPPGPAALGIVLDSSAAWAFSIDPIDDQMRYDQAWRDRYYLPLVKAHLWRDVTDLTGDWERYKVLCLPHVPVLSEPVRRRLRTWVEQGGRLLLGPLTGYRSEHFTAFTDQPFGGLESLIGAEADLGFSAHWREEALRVDFTDDSTCRTRAWCESFHPTTGDARVLARYHGPGEYAHGRAAVIEHALAKGKVITLGCMIDPPLYAAIAQRLLAEIDEQPLATGSSDVIVIPRADAAGRTCAYGLVNLADAPRQITLPRAGLDRLTGQAVEPTVTLDPLGVALIEC